MVKLDFTYLYTTRQRTLHRLQKQYTVVLFLLGQIEEEADLNQVTLDTRPIFNFTVTVPVVEKINPERGKATEKNEIWIKGKNFVPSGLFS